MAAVMIRPFRFSDGNCVEGQLRLSWRLQIPKQFNLTQVIAEQPVGHAIVAVCVAITYAIFGHLGTLCLALPGFYIAVYFVVLIFFLFQTDELLLKELSDIPKNYQSSEIGQFWVAEATEEEKQVIVGTVGLRMKSKTLAEIRHLMVMEDQKEKATITRKLLHQCLKFAKGKKFSEVELLTSAVQPDIAEVFGHVGFSGKSTFFMPSKHLYILPMQTLHVRLEDVDLAKLFDAESEKTE
ncbi:N-acetyltransferase 8 [Holothuria leucospilota]|uniref:N-acetyltransferase 8 n=1 Tax=Holothuria leucospilota TaxID=206669 RepID=A0A9Q1BJ85_HOLLE|nr:N-acetyltransferase 8 [Holothuria leucospilota]